MTMANKKVPGRAYTSEEKQAILNRIGAVWNAFPSLRLGQLIENARWGVGTDMFYVEDEKFVAVLEDYLSEHKRNG